MKESIGYTLTLNIAIVFIVIIFVFLSNIIIYYKAYKVSNVITSSIEKYEGFNDLAYDEIQKKLSSIGYRKRKLDCGDNILNEIQGNSCYRMDTFDDVFTDYVKNMDSTNYQLNPGEARTILRNGKSTKVGYEKGKDGYCVYKCIYELNNEYLQENEYFYIIKTNMYAEIPILNNFINYSIYTDTNIMYDFEGIPD